MSFAPLNEKEFCAVTSLNLGRDRWSAVAFLHLPPNLFPMALRVTFNINTYSIAFLCYKSGQN